MAKRKAGPYHKFRAKPQTINNIRFPSKKEAAYYQELLKRTGPDKEVLFFHMQVPIHLPGGAKYVVDFQEFHADGTVHYVDVKGFETKQFKLKKKIVEATYPFEIEVV